MGRKIVFIYISLIISKSKYSLCRKTFLKDWFFSESSFTKKKKIKLTPKERFEKDQMLRVSWYKQIVYLVTIPIQL